jgi:hypothetical protein
MDGKDDLVEFWVDGAPSQKLPYRDGEVLKCNYIRLRSDFYVEVLISLWLFLVSAAQSKEFFLDGLKKLEQRNHKRVELRGEDMWSKYIFFFNPVACFLYKAKDLSAPPRISNRW